MAREPHFPKDAAVGPGAASPGEPAQAGEAAAAGGETAKAVAAARAASGSGGGDAGRRKHLVAGAAIGIGSAAIVAALLYANRRGKPEKR
jgi:hypothetical protein